MSGGSYDYCYHRVEEMADELIGQKEPIRKAFGKHLKKVAKAMHDIEWVDSGDYGRDDEVASIREVVTVRDEAESVKEELEAIIGTAESVLKRLQ